jgi:hypothetical protein
VKPARICGVAAAILTCAIVFSGLVTLHSVDTTITCSRQVSEKILVGTKREDVIDLLGMPGDHTTKLVFGGPTSFCWYTNYDSWVGDEGIILVRFDNEGSVTDVAYFGVVAFEEPSWWQKLRDWIWRR